KSTRCDGFERLAGHSRYTRRAASCTPRERRSRLRSGLRNGGAIASSRARISGADPLFGGHAAQLGALALRHRVPAIYQYREFAAAGGLMSYGGYRYFGRFFVCTGFPNHFFCDSWVVGFLEGPTMVRRTSDWRDELGRWLKPFLDRLGHKARRQMCPLYVSGLIGPGDRKSIQPMAKRLALGECDQLHHFIAAGVWDATPVETELLIQADRLVGGDDAVLVIDDTAIPKK